MEVGGECLHLRKVGAEPALVRKKGILVHRGGARVDLDVAALIRAERESRSRRIPSKDTEQMHAAAAAASQLYSVPPLRVR